MKLVESMKTSVAGQNPATETLVLTGAHLDYLDEMSRGINPEMPVAFGGPHAIRLILDRIFDSGIDLTAASSEQEIAALAAGRLRERPRRRATLSTGSLSASPATRSAGRRAYRSILPATDPHRSEKPPR
jgi:hypothetical protein